MLDVEILSPTPPPHRVPSSLFHLASKFLTVQLSPSRSLEEFYFLKYDHPKKKITKY